MYANAITISDAITITVISVFLMVVILLGLSYFIDFSAWVISARGIKKKKVQCSKKTQEEPYATTSKPKNVQAEHDAQTLLLICAAVAAYEDSDIEHFHVRSIRQTQENMSAWDNSGLNDLMG